MDDPFGISTLNPINAESGDDFLVSLNISNLEKEKPIHALIDVCNLINISGANYFGDAPQEEDEENGPRISDIEFYSQSEAEDENDKAREVGSWHGRRELTYDKNPYGSRGTESCIRCRLRKGKVKSYLHARY
jgi:hypothetical protein